MPPPTGPTILFSIVIGSLMPVCIKAQANTILGSPPAQMIGTAGTATPEQPRTAYVQLAAPLDPGARKHITETLLDLDPKAVASERHATLKIQLDRALNEAQLEQAILASGVVTAEDIRLVTFDLKRLWNITHPHLTPGATVEHPVPGTQGDTTDLVVRKQAWMDVHARECPFGLTPACVGVQ